MLREDSDAAGAPLGEASSALRTRCEAPSPSGATATATIPISWQARMTRTAISPRLAMRIFLNIFLSSSRPDEPKILQEIPRSRRMAQGEDWFSPLANSRSLHSGRDDNSCIDSVENEPADICLDFSVESRVCAVLCF